MYKVALDEFGEVETAGNVALALTVRNSSKVVQFADLGHVCCQVSAAASSAGTFSAIIRFRNESPISAG